jgi:hypothetical protein
VQDDGVQVLLVLAMLIMIEITVMPIMMMVHQ